MKIPQNMILVVQIHQLSFKQWGHTLRSSAVRTVNVAPVLESHKTLLLILYLPLISYVTLSKLLSS